MAIAELDLTDRPACCVELPKHYRRASPAASRRLAGTQITASPDLNGRRRAMGFRYSRGRVDALLIEADYLADHPSRSGAIHARLARLDALVVTLDPIAAIKAGNTLAEPSGELTAISILRAHG